MAILDWPGKKQIREWYDGLRGGEIAPLFSVGQPRGCRLIQGDNLDVMVALRPELAGKVHCCYMDPPYNTGNKGWIYDDNASHPRLNDWLAGLLGGLEADRHDRWLSMMYPRLLAVKDLLALNGALFLSIDDREAARLKLLCDEVFGEECFVADVAVISNPGGRSDSGCIAAAHEHLLVYGMPGFVSRGEPDEGGDDARFPFRDERGAYRLLGLRKTGSNSLREDRPNLYYPFYLKDGRLSLEPREGAVEIYPSDIQGRPGNWRWGRERATACLSELEVRMSCRGWRVNQRIYRRARRIAPKSYWIGSEFSNAEGCRQTKALLGDRAFPTNKPLALMERCIRLSCPEDGVVLDPFAGSGATGHALWRLNATEGSRRRFVLIEMEAYARSLTARRLDGALEGYYRARKYVPPLPGGYQFERLL